MIQHICHKVNGEIRRYCNDKTVYPYVPDEVYKTWDECPICFSMDKPSERRARPSFMDREIYLKDYIKVK